MYIVHFLRKIIHFIVGILDIMFIGILIVLHSVMLIVFSERRHYE
jgi:hypothetical protein